MEKKFMELDEVAELLGLDRAAVYRLVRACELPAVKTNSGWFVARAEALKFKGAQ